VPVHLTRRRFLEGAAALGAAAAAAAAAAGRVPALGAAEAPAAPAASAQGRMHLGLVTYLVGAKMDLPTLIDACEKSGMEGVELRTTHAHGVEPTMDAAARAAVKERFAKTSVRLYALGSACEFHSPDPAVVRKNIEATRGFVQLAADLGAWGVKVRPNGLPKEVPEDQTLRQIGTACRECGEFAKEKGIVLFVECHGAGTAQLDRMAKIMQYCDHPSVGLGWNCNDGETQDGSPRAYFDLCKPWIRHVHIQDLSEKRYPWGELLELLKAMRYDGFTMIETTAKGDPVEFLRDQRRLWEKLAL